MSYMTDNRGRRHNTMQGLDELAIFIGQFKDIQDYHAQVKELLLEGLEGLARELPIQMSERVAQEITHWVSDFRDAQARAPKSGPAQVDAKIRFKAQVVAFAEKLQGHAAAAHKHAGWERVVDSFERDRDRIFRRDWFPNLYGELETSSRMLAWEKLARRLETLDAAEVNFGQKIRAAIDDFRQHKDAIPSNRVVLGKVFDLYQEPTAAGQHQLVKALRNSTVPYQKTYGVNIVKAYADDLKTRQKDGVTYEADARGPHNLWGDLIDAVYALRWAHAAKVFAYKMEDRQISMGETKKPAAMVEAETAVLADRERRAGRAQS